MARLSPDGPFTSTCRRRTHRPLRAKRGFREERDRPANELLLAVFSLALFIGGGILARRNLRRGYGDTRGGRRLAILVCCAGVIWAVLRAHHAPLAMEEWIFLLMATGWSLVWTAFAWLNYISLEPYVAAGGRTR